ncbi:Xanthine dehydrogenase [Roseibacterium elongatum DSM 19469]|uniref:Xanthine dehydrogenase n=1 Tax=Roseicyclus elongatus DSM 19469 TaxID=1294273 RepID=W8SJX7_9RHOB|nr:Xanthine dehydrogenase [Roseibacterium elongatum DSM 19469]
MAIRFLLNGEAQVVEADPTVTLLDWLREARRLTGTKEGCNEGDCGACTVMVTDQGGARALNACILFLPQLDGKAVRTVEGIAGADGTLHPVQQAMIDHHGSQCGFCTPGFVVSMATAHLNGRTDHDDQLAGNLCRCTGYAPIIRAAEAAADAPVPAWMHEDLAALSDAPAAETPFIPRTSDNLAEWYAANPEATLIAGATDVGLWVTKGLRDLSPVAFLNQCEDLKGIVANQETICVGAMTTLAEFGAFIADRHPSLAEMIRRYGSVQVRNAATIGGNIANGSPIGDSPPALIALGATLHLRERGGPGAACRWRSSLSITASRTGRRGSSSRPSVFRSSPTRYGSTNCRNGSIRTFLPSAVRSTSWSTGAPSPPCASPLAAWGGRRNAPPVWRRP